MIFSGEMEGHYQIYYKKWGDPCLLFLSSWLGRSSPGMSARLPSRSRCAEQQPLATHVRTQHRHDAAEGMAPGQPGPEGSPRL